MSRSPTVFVLGAGASAPYGFPLGGKLLMEIYKGIGPSNNESEGGSLAHQLREYGFDPQEVYSFRDDLYRSQQPSVDAFLENRKEYMEIGKAVIAAALIPYEREIKLFRHDWYEYLFGIIAPTPGAFIESNLSIITFNYDRSFEHCLFTALKASFGLSDVRAVDLLSNLPVVHVHGQLGGLPYLAEDAPRPYEDTVTPEIVKSAASRIRIIHEVDGLGPEFGRAHELIGRASKVCFLGFGYHYANVERLQINELFSSEVLGTGFGLENAERNRVHRLFSRGMNDMGSPNLDVLGFLRSHPVFD